jgi:DNA-binding LytR/AlgR family response regulator
MFIDIGMLKMDGFDLSGKFSKKDADPRICFICSEQTNQQALSEEVFEKSIMQQLFLLSLSENQQKSVFPGSL